ncbi:unnamed protein product [Cyprideis torosa]|uniref:Uncharacterized protein n=1 Tax=Cyprideis torosa TaxID=163714 RepID=A0A7R8WSG1_9CRUS|nr:unnamed protein product [Cyprideis torosa]CAG0903743.1 unnamed protein product [Cyprideis torosa]
MVHGFLNFSCSDLHGSMFDSDEERKGAVIGVQDKGISWRSALDPLDVKSRLTPFSTTKIEASSLLALVAGSAWKGLWRWLALLSGGSPAGVLYVRIGPHRGSSPEMGSLGKTTGSEKPREGLGRAPKKSKSTCTQQHTGENHKQKITNR